MAPACAGLYLTLRWDLLSIPLSQLRVLYTCPSLALLTYRATIFITNGWGLFMMDYCYASQLRMLWELWSVGHTPDSIRNVFLAVNGPVAGSTFLLRTRTGVLSGPDSFGSFFLHVVPMWLSFPIRWRIGAEEVLVTSVGSEVWQGFKNTYVPWMLPYGLLLCAQPLIPMLRDKLTLYDFNVHGCEPLNRDLPLWKWSARVWGYLGMHALMSLQGMGAAALAYHHYKVHSVWAACVFLGTIRSTWRYHKGTHAAGGIEPLIEGFKEIAFAWIAVGSTFAYCEWQKNRT
eukprot:gnl/TRDRNA2_/TRDRNA2_33440_c0_seq2.p1 gnl/TRDRNA2_/TRDRNA2_33440_c0~~gnl/TRDRNA2_/TRDRNA2_33440_c0_seq2.p1  ORF type:complete len:288 (+),score=26.84 gnl/TRDRNA2_/TRDRNA2_33440_c0_seq2:106-969(+)